MLPLSLFKLLQLEFEFHCSSQMEFLLSVLILELAFGCLIYFLENAQEPGSLRQTAEDLEEAEARLAAISRPPLGREDVNRIP